MPTAFPTILLPHIKPLALLKVISSKLSAAKASVDKSRKAIEKFTVITTRPIEEMDNSGPSRVNNNKRIIVTIWLDRTQNLLRPNFLMVKLSIKGAKRPLKIHGKSRREENFANSATVAP
jgi:hypothetical protein